MQTMTDLSPRLGVRPLCDVLSLSSATYYRHRCPSSASRNNSTSANIRTSVKRFVPRELTSEERCRVLEILHEPRFCDLALGEVYTTLRDEGTHLCSERTMYRILAENEKVRERRSIASTRTTPHQSCWPPSRTSYGDKDITKLKVQPNGIGITCTSCSMCSAATSWGGWSHIVNRRNGQATHLDELREAGHSSGSAHRARRSRIVDDIETGSAITC